MRTPTSKEMLALAELRGGMPLSAALFALLSATSPDKSEEELLGMSIGERDVRLMKLREQTFGRAVAAVAACPSCGEKLDVEFRLAELYAGAPVSTGTTCSCDADGFRVLFRCPAVADFVEPSAPGAAAPSRLALLKRCILLAENGSGPVDVEALPEEVVAAVVSAMAAADPMADVRLDISCPACGNRWEEDFDVASYLLGEIDAEARSLLRDVHLLASAYGWSEEEILNLGISRRNAYLEMIMSGGG